MNNINIYNYYLIGIGDFTHGSLNIWKFRINLLKKVMRETNKNIMIFVEDSLWRTENIMNNRKIVLTKALMWNNKYPNGILGDYVAHTWESKIYLEIIKFIRKHSDRITIIGVDNDKLARDRHMYKIIMKNLNKNNINFFWASNSHVDDRVLDISTRKWIKKKAPNETHYCGHYLKRKLGHKYCIILSQGYQGTVRYNSICIGDDCEDRRWFLQYIYKEFKYPPLKKYVSKNKNGYVLYKKFHNKLLEFSNSYWVDHSHGFEGGYLVKIKKPKYDYILFFNKVDKLDVLGNYT